MDGAGQSKRVICECLYKCAHVEAGHALVLPRTKRNHVAYDRAGKIHPSILESRRVRAQLLQSTSSLADTTDFEDGIENGMSESNAENRVISKSNGENRRKVYIICTCSKCCGRSVVHRNTERNHRALDEVHNRLKLRMENFIATDDMNSNFANDCNGGGDCHRRGRSVDVSAGSEQDGDSLENESPDPIFGEDLCRSADQQEPTTVSLQDAILLKVIEFQSVLDEYRIPQSLQLKLLKEFFHGGSDCTTAGFKGIPIGRLLTLAGPSWDFKCNDFQLPTTWKQLNDMYKMLGMTGPQRWRLCTGNKHDVHEPLLMKPSTQEITVGAGREFCTCSGKRKLRRDCYHCTEKCPKCQAWRKNTLAFDYMPIGDHIASLCRSRTFCYDVLNMWRHRERWSNPSLKPDSIYEFWDGSKARECAQFWNPTESWELPVICPNNKCNAAYAAFPHTQRCLELVDGWDATTGKYTFQCSKCTTLVSEHRRMVKGDPRNVALMGHWDGFQSASTTAKDCWTLEVVILNGGKSSILGPIPILFIPTSSKLLFKSKHVNILQHFLFPFVEELEHLFVDGISITEYAYPVSLISQHLPSSGTTVLIRAMLMMFTADHPAQCKIGGFKCAGYEACRRDHMACRKGKTIPKSGIATVEYPLSRKQKRFPPPPRTIDSIHSVVTTYLQCSSCIERKRIARSGPISCGSPLWRLHSLYAFDIARDLVFDTMHVLALCVFKKFTEILVLKTLASHKYVIDDALQRVADLKRTADLGSRWPHNPNTRLGYWKAEEYTIFVRFCLLHVLDSAGFDGGHVIGAVGMILNEISRLFYGHCRTHGWTEESILIARDLLSAWRIRMEESVGVSCSPLEHVAGNGDLLDDILRHGSHDIYWCYAFEREVSGYVNIASNQKTSEVTYTNFHARTWFSTIFQRIQADKDTLYPPQRALKLLHAHLLVPYGHQLRGDDCVDWHRNGIIQAHSQDEAKEIWSELRYLSKGCPCAIAALSNGIVVRKKDVVYEPLDPGVRTYLAQYWERWGCSRAGSAAYFENHVVNISYIFIHRTSYRPGDFVVVKPDGAHESQDWTWKCWITKIFSHQSNGKIETFFQGLYFNQLAVQNATVPLKHTLSQMCLLHPTARLWNGNDVRPVSHIMHKFLPLPDMARESLQNGYLVAYEIDDVLPRRHLLTPGNPGCYPPYPVVHDVVLAMGLNSTALAVVREVKLPEIEVHPEGTDEADSEVQDSDSDTDASETDSSDSALASEVADVGLIQRQASRSRSTQVRSIAQPEMNRHDIHPQTSMVGEAFITWLTTVRGRHNLYRAGGSSQYLSWHSLIKIVEDAVVAKTDSTGKPTEWVVAT